MSEQIAYINKTDLPDLKLNAVSDIDNCIEEALYNKVKIGNRDDLEQDHSKRQIIPYAVLMNGKIFTTFRKDGDNRLVGCKSVGVGGHISKEDVGHGDYILNGLIREINEELEIDRVSRIYRYGYICTDDDVGDVHMGIVYRVQCSSARVKEKDTLEGGWVSRVEDINNYEKWSQVVLQDCFTAWLPEDER